MKVQEIQAKPWTYKKHWYVVVGLVSCLYLAAIFIVNYEPDQSNLRLLLNLSVAIPSIVIWLIATRGTLRFKKYSTAIQRSKDGAGLNYIADALLWMLAYVIVLILASPLIGLVKDTSFLDIAVTLGKHLPLIIVLVSAIKFYQGALLLNSIVPLRISPVHSHALTALGVFGACLFVLYFYLTVPTLPIDNGLPRFTTPVETLIFTYALPHLLVWGLGGYASVSLFNYSLRVKGEIYKRSFRDLYKGVLLVFICTFAGQMLVISEVSLAKLNALLIVLYALLLLAVYGYLLIHRGAAQLHRIENI
jgi:hypothetical protein